MPSQAVTRPVKYVYYGAIAALLASGLAIRSWGVLFEPLDLWADEAWWATLLESRSLDEFGFRPFGYMWICRQLMEVGSAEIMLRLPSWFGAIAALFFIYRSADRTYRSRIAILFAVLLATFHPKLIVFAKEFKPYSVEVFVFSALIYWGLVCLRRGRASVGFLVAALAAIPICYPVVFLYPGIALAFAGERLGALRRLSTRQRIYGMVAVITILVFTHLFLFERLGVAQSRWFWGSKYDVFPIGTGFVGGLAWYAEKTWAILSLSGGLELVPAPLRSWFAVAFVGGVYALIRSKRFGELAILGAPLIATAVANVLGYWPYGAFRTNLFLTPGLLLIGGHGLDWLAGIARLRVAAHTIVALVLVAVLSVDPRSYGTKSSAHWAPSPQLTEVIEEIERRRFDGSGDWNNVILADWHSWRPILFYLCDYPVLRAQSRLVRGPLANVEELERQIADVMENRSSDSRPIRLWVVVTRQKPHGAIRSSEWVRDLAVFRREFRTRDQDYHPVLFELRSR